MGEKAVKYLVTGANGQLGTRVLDTLLTKVPASDVVALVRRADTAAALEAKGVEVRIADYRDSAALTTALRGIDRLMLISSSAMDGRAEQHRNVVQAAKSAGVQFIAYTSLLKADTSPLALAVSHRATEADLAASEIPYALLRNSWYTENNALAVAPALQYGVMFGAAGDGRISGASRQDYAEAAVAVITADRPPESATYELAGDKSYSLSEFAASIARVSGKPVVYKNMSEQEYKATLENAAGLPAPMAAMLADSDLGASQGALEDDSHTLSQLIGRPTTPFEETIRQTLEALTAKA